MRTTLKPDSPSQRASASPKKLGEQPIEKDGRPVRADGGGDGAAHQRLVRRVAGDEVLHVQPAANADAPQPNGPSCRIDELRAPRLQGTGTDTTIRVAHGCPSRNHCWPRPLSGWLHAMKPGQWCQRQLGLARLLWRRQVHPRCDECCSFHEGVDRQFWSMETVLDLHSAPSPLPARDWGDLGNPVARRRRSAEDRLFRVGGFLQAAAEHACFEVVLDVGDGGRHVSEGDDGAGRGVGVVPGFSPRYRMRQGEPPAASTATSWTDSSESPPPPKLLRDDPPGDSPGGARRMRLT